MVVLGAYLSYVLSVHLGIGLLPGLLLTIPAMFLLGVAIEFCFMRRLRDRTGRGCRSSSPSRWRS